MECILPIGEYILGADTESDGEKDETGEPQCNWHLSLRVLVVGETILSELARQSRARRRDGAGEPACSRRGSLKARLLRRGCPRIAPFYEPLKRSGRKRNRGGREKAVARN